MDILSSVCRICLADNCVRFRSIVDTYLQEIHESLTSSPFVTEDGRPVVVCDICCAKLEDCYQLRRSCIQSENLFTQMLKCIVQVRLQKISPDIHIGSDNAVETVPTGSSNDEVQHDAEVAEQDPLDYYCIQPSDPEEDSSVLVLKIEVGDTIIGPPVTENPLLVPRMHHENTASELVKGSDETEVITEHPKNITNFIRDAKLQMVNNDVDACDIVDTIIHEHTEDLVKTTDNSSTKVQCGNKTNILQGIHNNTCKKLKTYSCDTCQKCFNTESSLNVHIRRHVERPSDCDFSMNRSIKKSFLNSHLRTHTAKKPYECDICWKRFTYESNLNSHIRTHTREKPYICDICKKYFKQKYDLETHILTHTSDEPYSCHVCKKRFSRKGDLGIHIRTHTDEKPHKCDICEKSFSYKSILINHVRTHTGEKPYICDVCNKCYCQKSDLNKHNRTHTGEKPYICNVCNKCFAKKGTLNNHIRTHTGEKPHSCEICKKCFSQIHNLYRHIRTHTGEKPFICDVCKKCFTNKGTLYKHVRTHRDALH